MVVWDKKAIPGLKQLLFQVIDHVSCHMLCEALRLEGSHTCPFGLCPLLHVLIIDSTRGLVGADPSFDGTRWHRHTPSYNGRLLNLIRITFIWLLAVVQGVNGSLRIIRIRYLGISLSH